MLITDIEEVREYVSVNKSFDLENIAPYLDRAESKYIIPVLGDELYDYLNRLVNAEQSPDLTETQELILEKARKALSNFAYALYLPLAQVQIDNAGVRIANTETMKTAWEWQIRDLQRDFYDAGWLALEDLQKFLEQNAGSGSGSAYDYWLDSSAYTILKECFINSADEFDKFYFINKSRRLYSAIKTAMKRVEILHAKPSLGAEYFDELKTKIKDESLTADDVKLLDTYLRPAVANLTIAESISELPVIIGNDALSLFNNERIINKSDQKDDAQRISALQQKSLCSGMDFLKALRVFLNENANANLYATYFNSDTYSDPEEDNETPEPPAGGGIYF